MPKNFIWAPGSPLPNIEPHSDRKLEVLEKYLDVYFDTVVPNPATDCLNITLVDGFCGGGAYNDKSTVRFGSPLILLRAVESAETRLNAQRAKPLRINARFIFVDENEDHIAALREQLVAQGYQDKIGNCVELICGKFDEELSGILTKISSSQRAGRSIFVLDQFGYSDVPMHTVNSIFTTLDRPEVLLTFAIDGLLNYLREESATQDLYRQFGVDQRFIQAWQDNKDSDQIGRMLSQRMLMTNIQRSSGAEFFTPFMLWSRTDNRWMMIAHLSRHQAARDKMLGVHWESQNSFRHFGRGSLFNLGYDPRVLDSRDSLFNFSDADRNKLASELLEEIPREISELAGGSPLAIADFLEKIGNRTAATNADLFSVISDLSVANEIEVISNSGGLRRLGTKIRLDDRLRLPNQSLLFSLRANRL